MKELTEATHHYCRICKDITPFRECVGDGVQRDDAGAFLFVGEIVCEECDFIAVTLYTPTEQA